MSTSTPSPKRPFSARNTPPLIPAADFNPAPHLTEQILSDINDNDIALPNIAEKANTSIESLTLWLTRPEIDARLNAMESVFARRCRLQLANRTGSIMTACSTCIDQFNHAQSHLLFEESNDLRAHTVLNRKASNALLASRILLHLAKHFSNPIAPRQARPQSPSPAPTPTPNSAPTSDIQHPTSDIPSTSRFTILPPLPDVLNLHDLRSTNNTTPDTPTRDNGVHDNTIAALQPDGLTGNRRGLGGVSESSSDTPGKHATESPHPERVQPETPQITAPCACSAGNSRTSKPCHPCTAAASPSKSDIRHPTSDIADPSHPCSSVAKPASTLITIAGRAATRSPRARDPTTSKR